MTRIIQSLAEVSAGYDALLVDLWGCLHDGVRAYPAAVEALVQYRAGGGAVALVTNAPRHRGEVAKQIARMGVPDTAWDVIASSGDAARMAMYRGAVGQKVWFMGEPHDLSFFDPMPSLADALSIAQVPLEQAEGIVCCGPFDAHAPIEDLRAQLLWAKQKGLKLLCANPDIVVDRGDVREWCAGAVAAMYDEMGGESLYFGKPYPPIYDLARQRLAEAGQVVPEARILAIGDGIATDIAGAIAEDIDSLFIAGGLAADDVLRGGLVDPDAARAYLARHKLSPTFVAPFLA